MKLVRNCLIFSWIHLVDLRLTQKKGLSPVLLIIGFRPVLEVFRFDLFLDEILLNVRIVVLHFDLALQVLLLPLPDNEFKVLALLI